MVDKYLSITDFSELRGVTPTATTSPTLTQVNEYITLAENEFDDKCGDFSEQTGLLEIVKGKKFQTEGGIYIPNGHITSLTLLEVSDGDLYDPTFTEITNTPIVNYVLDNSLTGRVLIRNYIPKREYRITFNSGYALASVPSNIKYIVYLMTMKRLFQGHAFDNNVNDNVTTIIDVDVYREITKGGSVFEGLGALNSIILDEMSTFKGNLRTSIGW